MKILDWLLGGQSPSDPPDLAAILAASYADDPALGLAERIQRAVWGHRLRDLPSFGADGFDALVACLAARSGMTYHAEGTLADKNIAMQATPALAAALDDPAAVFARAGGLGLLAKVDEGEEPKRFVYKKTLSVLARGGDERGVPAVVRVYRRNDEYSESALGTLAEMLTRKRVCKRLTEEQLSELVNLPDHSQPIIGEEADRFATTVYWGERVLSCESVRTLAREEMERRAQRS